MDGDVLLSRADVALALKRHLGVSYPTAWLMRHKLMRVMYERERPPCSPVASRLMMPFSAVSDRVARDAAATRCPFSPPSRPICTGGPAWCALTASPTTAGAAIGRWASTAINSGSLALSDGWAGFTSLAPWVQCHEPHVTGHGPKAAKHPEFHWVNTLLSNLKTALSGTFHAFDFQNLRPPLRLASSLGDSTATPI